MMLMLGWLAEAMLAVLLIGTLIMTIRLDRALKVVRRDRAVFETLINNLGSATNSVKLGIQALRNEADRAADQIERRSVDADKLATDLSFLIEAADRAGARLDIVRQARPDPDMPLVADITYAVDATANTPSVGDSPPADARAAQPPVTTPSADGTGGVPDGLRQLAGLAKRRPARVAETPSVSRRTTLEKPAIAGHASHMRSRVAG